MMVITFKMTCSPVIPIIIQGKNKDRRIKRRNPKTLLTNFLLARANCMHSNPFFKGDCGLLTVKIGVKIAST